MLSKVNKIRCGTLLILLASILWSCKAKLPNAEPKFRIFFIAKESTKPKKLCFDEVKGLGGAPLETCIDSASNVLYMPINIASDTSMYLFAKGSDRDTLVINYGIKMDDKGYGWIAEVLLIKIKHTSFDSISVNCKNGATSCPDDIESINIYY